MSRSKNKQRYAKKSLGQNFLVDKNYVDKIISALDPKSNQTVVEIGAGRGAITRELVKSAGKVLAIEIDRDLIPILLDDFSGYENFQLIEKDALEIDFKNLLALQNTPIYTKLVANLPYYISTAILQHLIRYRGSFSEFVLMLQREVVERITAEAGNKERGFLTVLIKAYFETEKLFDVTPKAFRPAPKVWSSVVRLKPKAAQEILEPELFREIVSLGFGQKRKTILNNLKNAKDQLGDLIERKGGVNVVLDSVEIDKGLRAEALEVDDWFALSNSLSQKS